MNQTVFPFKSLENNCFDTDWTSIKKRMIEFRDGEIIIRKKIKWDYDQMRKYLHGPVSKFMIVQFAGQGTAFSMTGMHKWLRDEFLPGIPKEIGGKLIPQPVSSETIGRDGYVLWLNRINEWAMDNFGCGIPPAEQVE